MNRVNELKAGMLPWSFSENAIISKIIDYIDMYTHHLTYGGPMHNFLSSCATSGLPCLKLFIQNRPQQQI